MLPLQFVEEEAFQQFVKGRGTAFWLEQFLLYWSVRRITLHVTYFQEPVLMLR